jgi:ATP-dependent Clp protease ATP-binding subunit ClpA
MTVAARVKEAFERAAREAERRGTFSIEPTVLLLGIVDVDDSLANRLLRDNGIDPTEIRGLLAGNHR